MALFLFDTSIDLSLTLPNNQELSLSLGLKTIVHVTLTQSLSVIGLSNSGAVPTDKMVVCFNNVTFSSAFALTHVHESVSTTNAAFRFRNAGLGDLSGGNGIGAAWFEYFASQSRWIMIGRTT